MIWKVTSWPAFAACLLLTNAALAACPAGSPGGINCTIGSAFVNTNAALKAATAGFSTYVYRAGYYTAGDGGDALYYWSASSTCTDDGGSCIAPTTGTGRWLLSGAGSVSIKVFGALCDGTDDDTIAIRNALAARSAAFIPANSTCGIQIHSNSDGIPLHSGYHLYGENALTSTLEVLVYQTTTPQFPTFDFAANGKFKNIVVSQLFPPPPYALNGNYSFDAFTTLTGGNGSLTANSTYYIKVAAVDAAGVTLPSSTYWHITVGAGATNTITVDIPNVIGDGTGFNVYASTTPTGTYFKQNSAIVPPSGSFQFTFGTAANPFLTSGTAAPTTNTTSVTVGDVNTRWSHQLNAGATLAVAGSATAALNNAAYTVQQVTFPDHMIIRTSGVAAGTYTDPTSVKGPSGIGTAVFYTWNRDNPTLGGVNNEQQKIELDHFQVYYATTNVPGVVFDATGTYGMRIHHIDVKGPVSNSGVIGIRCSDASPYNNLINGACFFYHFSDITGSLGTFIHLSVNNNPPGPPNFGPGPNAGAGMMDNFQGGSMVLIDLTTAGSTGENGGGMFLQAYVSNAGDLTAYDSYPGSPTGSHVELWSCEGCVTHGDPANFGPSAGAFFSIYPATPNLFTNIPPIQFSGGIVNVSQLPPCQGGKVTFYAINDSNVTTPTIGQSVTGTGGGSNTFPIYCDGVGPNWKYH